MAREAKPAAQSAPPAEAREVESPLAAENATLRAEVHRLTGENADLRELLESATKPTSDKRKRVVHVSSANPAIVGFCAFGKQLTAEGFDLDVTEWSEKQLTALADPMLVVEG